MATVDKESRRRAWDRAVEAVARYRKDLEESDPNMIPVGFLLWDAAKTECSYLGPLDRPEQFLIAKEWINDLLKDPNVLESIDDATQRAIGFLDILVDHLERKQKERKGNAHS